MSEGFGEDGDVADEPTLADLIRRLRGGLTQGEFAERVGLSSGMIGQVETGAKSLGLESLEQITTAYNLNATQAAELRAARDRRSMELSRKSAPPTRLDVLESSFRELVQVVRELCQMANIEMPDLPLPAPTGGAGVSTASPRRVRKASTSR